MTSRQIAASSAGLYGLVALTGGIIGFVKAGSLASLIAGGISGLILIACAAFIPRRPKPALIVALVVGVALVGRFLPKAIEAGAVALVMTLGGILVVVACAVALKRERSAAAA